MFCFLVCSLFVCFFLPILILLLLFLRTLSVCLFFKELKFAQQLRHKSDMRRHNPRNPVSLGACTPFTSLYSHPSCHLFSAILTHRLKWAQECLPALKSYIYFPVHNLPSFVSTVPPGPFYAFLIIQRCCLLLYKANAVATAVSTASLGREDRNIPK